MTLLLTLLGFSLLDSTSIGTLVLPLLMVVIATRVNWKNLAVYFSTVMTLYFGIGLLLLLGAGVIMDVLGDALTSRPAYWALMMLGVGLFAISWKIGGKNADPERFRRMVERGGQPDALVGMALAAVAMEVAMMFPYLGAIGLLSASDWNWATRIGLLALYCVVMILPALLIIGVAALFGDRLWRRLERFSGWVAKQTEETVSWIVGIAGVYMAAHAAVELGLIS